MKRRLIILLSCFLVWTMAATSVVAQTELNREAALKTLEQEKACIVQDLRDTASKLFDRAFDYDQLADLFERLL